MRVHCLVGLVVSLAATIGCAKNGTDAAIPGAGLPSATAAAAIAAAQVVQDTDPEKPLCESFEIEGWKSLPVTNADVRNGVKSRSCVKVSWVCKGRTGEWQDRSNNWIVEDTEAGLTTDEATSATWECLTF
jgi:ABC-type uncharacterized transport system permease subunit